MVGLHHFKAEIYQNWNEKITRAIISIINDEHDGAIIDKTLVKSIVELYGSMGILSLNVYILDLEIHLLEAMRIYYGQKRKDWIAKCSTPLYLTKTEKALEEEKTRIMEHLNFLITEPKICKVVEDEILQKVQMNLLEKKGSGCIFLLANNKTNDLQRMFHLFSRLESGLQTMAKIVEKFITVSWNACIAMRKKDKNDDPEFVKSLICLHEKCLVIHNTFLSHPLFQKVALISKDFVNADIGQYSKAELMSNYCNRILKSAGEKLSEAEVQQRLDRIVQLFSCLYDKDLFAELLRNQLAKQLLNGRSARDSVKKIMIAKLKEQCGTQFTSKMEGMLNDLAVGSKQKNEFDQRMEQHGDITLSFGVQVLTIGIWPSYKAPEVALPEQMSK